MTGDAEMAQDVETMLSAIKRIPGVGLADDEAHGYTAVRVDGRLVARIDLRRGEAHVNAPADVVAALARAFPTSRPSATGIVFDLTSRQDKLAAAAAIRRRVNVERLVWQFRVGSP
jgi:hypothetical protein